MISFFTLLFLGITWATSVPIQKQTLINGCTLYEFDGSFRRFFPGDLCVFLDDGSFISGDKTRLARFDKNQKKLWQIDGLFHHQLNLSHDGKRLLALSRESYTEKKKEFSVDVIMILSLDGKILQRRSYRDILRELNQSFIYAGTQVSHLNSIHEIPTQKGEASHPAIKAGNIIVNSHKHQIVILSPELKPLHYQPITLSLDHQVHDVQVTSRGSLLYFNNFALGSTEFLPYSSIQESSLKGDVIFEFSSEPKQMFFSRFCGGVQEINEDLIFFSHMLTGAYLYSRKEKKLIKNIFQTNFQAGGNFSPAQEIKAKDLHNFLRYWD